MTEDLEQNGWNEFNRINVQSLFNWAVFTLAFLTAMLGVLTFVHQGVGLSVLGVYSAVYAVLLFGLLGCFHVTVGILRVVNQWRAKFREQHKENEELVKLLRDPRIEIWVIRRRNQGLILSFIAILSIAIFVARASTTQV